MISEQAKHGVSQIFTRAALTHLAMAPSDTVEIEALAGRPLIDMPERHAFLLTVASYHFRLLTFFHVGDDPVSVDYFTRADPGRDFAEAFGEVGNLCCGAMNRDLGEHFVHTGMSTPYLLPGKCVPFIGELKPAYVAQYRIAINDSVRMHASLCLCAYARIDFRFDPQSAPAQTGELELF